MNSGQGQTFSRMKPTFLKRFLETKREKPGHKIAFQGKVADIKTATQAVSD